MTVLTMTSSASLMPTRSIQQGRTKMMSSFLRKSAIAALAACAIGMVHASPASAADPAARLSVASANDSAGVVQKSVKVGLNKSIIVDLPRDARDILVSNPAIADAVIRTPRRIYITGVQVGQSNVIVFDRAGQQIVSLELAVERDASLLSAMLQRLVPDSDVNVEIVSDNIVLSGTVKNASDSRKAQDIANIFANGGANAQPDAGSSSISGGSGGFTISSGEVPKSSVVNMLTVEGEDQVHLKVTVAEVQRSIAKQLGVQFAGNINAGSLTTCANPLSCSSLGNPFAVNGKSLSDNSLSIGYNDGTSSISATLKALEETGMVRTLAEPTLTAISGESASFLAGGEFPVPSGRDSSGQISISFKPYGVALAFTPVVLTEGRISLRVKTEVSELSTEGSVSFGDLSIPGLKVRRAESTMELPSGGSMLLGGLLQDSSRQAIDAMPGLGKLPILGQLFRSRDFKRNETELVIIITPYLVKPVPRSALATPDQGFALPSDAQTLFLGNLNRVYGGPSDKPASYAHEQYKGHVGFIYE
jgi:pilus assembly protein CpaC